MNKRLKLSVDRLEMDIDHLYDVAHDEKEILRRVKFMEKDFEVIKRHIKKSEETREGDDGTKA